MASLIQPEKRVTLEEYRRWFILTTPEKTISAALGAILLGAAALLYLFPQSGETVETQNGTPTKRTKTTNDPTNLVIAVGSVGVALIVYSLNGIRFSKLEGPGFKGEGHAPPPFDKNSEPNPQASPKDTADEEVREVRTAAKPPQDPLIQEGPDPATTFLLRSSWNGLKILKACAWALKGRRIINIEELCHAGFFIEPAYVQGFFVAAFSANIIRGFPSENGALIIHWVDPIVVENIDRVIDGMIGMDVTQVRGRRADLDALLIYLRTRV